MSKSEASPKLKTLKKSDNVVMIFGEWFDKTYGNTYYDIEVWVGDDQYNVALRYGCNAGDAQSIDEGLEAIGFKVRKNSRNHFAQYKHIKTKVISKLKRDAFKVTEKVS